ncbi:E3 ubiquitin-protein ligase WAV3-like isoform X2 [Primulina eburnea]|uniref:E3 ubiquitin-protein ligase WAV3-like isoform X2 n=1 Tax=Primulina eburnea TaxID=1245227 RepID=UPI003C6C4F70
MHLDFHLNRGNKFCVCSSLSRVKMVGSKWTKVKVALGLKMNSCLYVSRMAEDLPALASPPPSGRFSDASSLSPTCNSGHRVRMPTTPTPSSSGLRLPKHSTSKSSKICAICLATLKPGRGHAIFTAECSHMFHFHCIASNSKHGHQSCPVCRAKWKEIPFQCPVSDKAHGRSRTSNVPWLQDDSWTTVIRPSPRVASNGNVAPFHSAEPHLFDDDDEVTIQQPSANQNTATVDNFDDDGHLNEAVEVKTYTELSAVSKFTSHKGFSVLIHLKAPAKTLSPQNSTIDGEGLSLMHQNRAPVDLVAVLDVSGSMAGTKLALLKRAMGFVIQNLGPHDRLSVISFSSIARRIFSLRRMTETGRNESIQAVNSLTSNGGTNIAEGLRKAAKVMTDRKWKNPVSSMILLSDGQDTYSNTSPSGASSCSDYHSLLPVSIHPDSASSVRIPVHTFGFGADHDAVLMHLISETSGGTFSFIEAESVIQDAFAQCIGGLLSVIVQDLKVEVECIDPLIRFNRLQSGSYKTILDSDKRKGSIDVGDLYAEEERDFLLTIDIPIDEFHDETSLLQVRCEYRHPVTNKIVILYAASEVKILRPLETGPLLVSMEVDKQRNRLRSAEAMAEAKAAADQGDLTTAVSILEKCRKKLSETVSSRAGDRLCLVLDAELREMQERMANRKVYETSGRAYVLSGLSSHSWQRATARGDSTDSTSLVQAYQTPSMVNMVNLSQTMIFRSSSTRPALRSALSFPARAQPR